MKKKRRILPLIMASVVLLQFVPISTRADYLTFDTSDFMTMINATKEEITKSKSVTFDDLFAGIDVTRIDPEQTAQVIRGLEQTQFGQLRFDVPMEIPSVGELNLKYAALSTALLEDGYQAEYALSAFELQGYTQDINSAFSEVFPDKDVSIEEARLPEGMTFENMISAVKNSRANAVTEFQKQPAYKDTIKAISTKKYVPSMSERPSLETLWQKAGETYSKMGNQDEDFETRKASVFAALTKNHQGLSNAEKAKYGAGTLGRDFTWMKSVYQGQSESVSQGFDDMNEYVMKVYSDMFDEAAENTKPTPTPEITPGPLPTPGPSSTPSVTPNITPGPIGPAPNNSPPPSPDTSAVKGMQELLPLPSRP